MKTFDPKITEIVNDIFHSKFEVPRDKILPGSRLKDDLGLDSLDFVDMFVLLEQKLGKTPEDIQVLKIQTIGDIYQLVTDLQNSAK